MNSGDLRVLTPIQQQVAPNGTRLALRASGFVGLVIFLWLLWPAACGKSVVACAGEPADTQSDFAAEQEDMDRLLGYWDLTGVKSDGQPFGKPYVEEGAGIGFRTNEQGDMEQLQGYYVLNQAESFGKPDPEADSDRRFKGNEVLLSSGKRQIQYIVVDRSTTPKHWDVIIEPLGGHTVTRYVLKGIYVLDGNSLVICFTKSPLSSRPEDFECVEGSNRYLLVLEKRKEEEGTGTILTH